MNAADYYALEELKSACTGFIQVRTTCFIQDRITMFYFFVLTYVLQLITIALPTNPRPKPKGPKHRGLLVLGPKGPNHTGPNNIIPVIPYVNF